MKTVALVAVDNAAFHFDKLYSYRVPDDLVAHATVGARVLVPFGNGAPRMGVVLGVEEDSEEGAAPLKAIIDIERGVPLLDGEFVQLILLLRETTFCSYYDAVRTVLPKNSRLVPDDEKKAMERAAAGHLETVYRFRAVDPLPRLTEKQHIVCEALRDAAMTAGEVMEKTGATRAVINRLVEKDILERFERQKDLDPLVFSGVSRAIPDLTAAQREAYETIVRFMEDAALPDTTLLHGVTSSGKTIIYIKLIERAVAAKKSALVLVPEIALATQMILRLRELFGDQVAILHSALSDSERQLQWNKVREGRSTVVVGTRTAVFAPLQNPGILIIDEEQEGSYWSEQNPRYSAGVVAAWRAKHHGAHLLLASATPSVENYYRAQKGVYNFVKLSERFGDMPLPKVRVVDMRRELLAGNSHHVSNYLHDEVAARIARGEQCILLLNRRGYRTVSMCRKCRAIVKCKNCDTPLVVHKSRGSYICHYCGRAYPVSETCDSCDGQIMHTGIGTQKVEEDLELLFPQARILRLDIDSTTRKHAMEEYLYAFSRGEFDMMVGTQMIAKGLDFGNVTLAGVLSIDQMLLMPGFRANERTFSMLTQVVGRSGRGDKEGEAVIQTIDPENDVIRDAAKQDYEAFYKTEIVSRKAHLYPPFCGICTIGFVSESEETAAAASEEFARILMSLLKLREDKMPIRILGPAAARVAYVNDLYRYRVIIKHRPDATFRAFLRGCLTAFGDNKLSSKTRIYIDFSGETD